MKIQTKLTNLDVALTTIINFLFRSKVNFLVFVATKFFIAYRLITGYTIIDNDILFWAVNFVVEIATLYYIIVNISKYNKLFKNDRSVEYQIDDSGFTVTSELGVVKVKKKDISNITIRPLAITVYEGETAKIFILKRVFNKEQIEIIKNYK